MECFETKLFLLKIHLNNCMFFYAEMEYQEQCYPVLTFFYTEHIIRSITMSSYTFMEVLNKIFFEKTVNNKMLNIDGTINT